MTDSINTLIKYWDNRASTGASKEVIDDVQQQIGFELPPSLIEFMKKMNGGSGYMTEASENWIRLDPIEDWPKMTAGYGLDDRGLVHIGSDGGDGAYAINIRTSPMQFVWAAYGDSGSTYYGETFEALLQHLRDGTKPKRPKRTGRPIKPAKLPSPPKDKPLRELKGHLETICGMAVSPGGTRVATVSTDCTARVFDIGSGKQIALIEGERALPIIGWVGDDQALVCVQVKEPKGRHWPVQFVEMISGRQMGHLGIDEFAGGSGGAFSRDGRAVMMFIPHCWQRYAEVGTGQKIADLPTAKNKSFSVTWRKDDKLIALGRSDRIDPVGWDSSREMGPPQPDGHVLLVRAGGEQIGWIKGSVEVLRCEFDNDDRLLVVRRTDLQLYHVPAFSVPSEPVLTIKETRRTIASGCFVGKDRLAITTAEGEMYLHDLSSGQRVRTLRTTKSQIGLVAATPDGKLLLTANGWTYSKNVSKNVRVWDVSGTRQ